MRKGESKSTSRAYRQVFDLPPPPPLIVTEHRAYTCQCHHCGAQIRAAFPEAVTSPAQYGDGIAALAAYLQNSALHPREEPGAIDFGYLRHQYLSGNAGQADRQKGQGNGSFCRRSERPAVGRTNRSETSGRDRVKGRCREFLQNTEPSLKQRESKAGTSCRP